MLDASIWNKAQINKTKCKTPSTEYVWNDANRILIKVDMIFKL